MPPGTQHRPGPRQPKPLASAGQWCRLPAGGVAAAAQGGVVFPDLFQGDGQVGDQDDVVVAQDHLDLGAGAVCPISEQQWQRFGHQSGYGRGRV